jgi:hypothetical protein
MDHLMPINEEPWYSIKSIFEHTGRSQVNGKAVYEERVIVVKAKDFDDAITQGEKEALVYANLLEGVIYLGFIGVYHLSAKRITHTSEVYSIMRE